MPRKRYLIIASILMFLLAAPVAVFWFRETEAGHHWLERQVEIVSHKSLIRVAEGATPTAFVTDGCSGGMSIFWRDLVTQFPTVKEDFGNNLPWENCCISHDRAYHDAGGAKTANTSFKARVGADQALRSCVADLTGGDPANAGGYRVLSDAIYTSVRLGGAPCSGLPWRWGYGLPSCFVGHQFFETDD